LGLDLLHRLDHDRDDDEDAGPAEGHPAQGRVQDTGDDRSDRDRAEDLAQETFARALQAPPDNPRPWLFAVAARVRLDELRRRLRLPEDADEDAVARADEQSASDPAPDTDVRDAVRAALDALPQSQRTVIHLHRYEGMTFAEIAQVLGTTAGAVKLRAFRGYETLREQLKGLL